MDCLDSAGYMEVDCGKDYEGTHYVGVGNSVDTFADHNGCRVLHPGFRECDKPGRATDCCTDGHWCVLVDCGFG